MNLVAPVQKVESHTKEGWRSPFRALVPRLDPMPN